MMLKKYTCIFLFLPLIFQACISDPSDQDDRTSEPADARDTMEYATLFRVSSHAGYTVLELPDPWAVDKPPQQLLLVPAREELPNDILPAMKVIRTPVTCVTVMSGTHIAFLDLIGETDKICGVGSFRLIKNEKIKKKIDSGEVRETGTNGNYKQEQFLALNPDVAFMTPYQDQSVAKLREMGIPVVPVADYMENHPLGRAEWLRFMSYFFQKQDYADSIFRSTAKKYQALSSRFDTLKERPAIFSGKPYGGIWYQPGGQSYIARLFKNAGADYLWSDKEASGALPLDFETVYAKAANADFWRLVVKSEQPYDYEALLREDERYADFEAFRQGNIIVCNVADVPYYEVAPTEPDVVLADLIKHLHQGALPDHEPVYYKKMEP